MVYVYTPERSRSRGALSSARRGSSSSYGGLARSGSSRKPQFTVNTKNARGCRDLLNVICDLRGDWRATNLDATLRDDVLWVRGSDVEVSRESAGQRVSRIPELRRLCTKSGLARLVGKEQFHPRTFILSADDDGDKSDVIPLKAWRTPLIYKPNSGAQGNGITILFSAEELERHIEEQCGGQKNAILQKVIERPHLLEGGFKWDARVYCLILSTSPPRVFMSTEGLVRVCSEPWTPPTEGGAMNSQLTNYSISKLDPSFVHSDDPRDGERGTKRTLSSTFEALRQRGCDTDRMMRDISDIVSKTSSAMLRALREDDAYEETDCNFHVLGYDILFDEDLDAHLLEVNYSPSLDICSIFPLGETKPRLDHEFAADTAHADLVLAASVVMGRRAEKRCNCTAHNRTHVHRPCAVDLVAKQAAIEGSLIIVERDANSQGSISMNDLCEGTDFVPCRL